MRFLLSIFLVVIIVVLSGCNGEQLVGKAEDPSKQTTKLKAPKQKFKVGDVVKIGGTELVIKSAKLIKGNPSQPPKKGNVLEVAIEAKNNGDQRWILIDGDFDLYDKNGEELEKYYSIEDENLLSDEVKKGSTVKGKIFYDVPGKGIYELRYYPDFLQNQEVKFDIELSK